VVVQCVQGASAQCVNKEAQPALHVAVFNGHADAVKVLVDEGADVNVRGPTNGNTALHEAVLLGPSVSCIIDALLAYVSKSSFYNIKLLCCVEIAHIVQTSANYTMVMIARGSKVAKLLYLYSLFSSNFLS